MFIKLLKRRNKPPSERMALAYQAAHERFITWLIKVVRRWETQPVRARKMQLIFGLVGLLLLGSVSVYWTATGHITRVNQKHHEQKLRRK